MTIYPVGAPGAAAALPAGAAEKRFEDWGRIKGQDGKKKWVNRRRKRQKEEQRANRSKLSQLQVDGAGSLLVDAEKGTVVLVRCSVWLCCGLAVANVGWP